MKVEELLLKNGFTRDDVEGLVIEVELYYDVYSDEGKTHVYFSSDNIGDAEYDVTTIEDVGEAFKKYLENFRA